MGRNFRPTLAFDQAGDRQGLSRRATRYENFLVELWRRGAAGEARGSIDAITKCAQDLSSDGQEKPAARLYTALARNLEAVAEFDDARQIVSAALSTKQAIERQVLHELMRLRARLALDTGDTADALAQIRKVERPIIIRSSTLTERRTGGRVKIVRDSRDAGETTREKEGRPTAPTLLLEAEICLTARNGKGAHHALDRAARVLLDTPPEKRSIDDTAMLQLFRLLDPDKHGAAEKDSLLSLAAQYAEKGASAPVISRITAAAGGIDGTGAINERERDRFMLFGKNARL